MLRPNETRWFAPGLLVALAIQSCASAPPEPRAAASGAAPAEAQVAATGSAPPKDPYPGMTQRTGPDGMKLYCRKEIATGERIPKERCYTEQAMRQMEEQRRDFEKSRENSTYATGGT